MLPNQKIVSNTKNPIEWLIVDLSNDYEEIALVDLLNNPVKRPFKKSVSVIQALLADKKLTLQCHDFPPVLLLNDAELPKKWITKRDSANDSLRGFIDNPQLQYEYLFGNSSGVLSSLMKSSKRSRKYISTTLNRFFAFGGSANALLPQYFSCGIGYQLPDDYKKLMNGEICMESKRGRPTSSTLSEYVTTQPKEVFRGATKKDIENIVKIVSTVKSGDTIVLTSLYKEYCKRFYSVTIDHISGEFKTTKVLLPSTHRISPRAFKYHLCKMFNKLYFKRKEVGAISSARDLEGKSGVAREGLRGAGSRYEIDSTIMDIYIRYPYSNDEQLATGRPILFLVIDVFSGMIVGIHIAFDGPNWHSAGQALFNAMTDKVEFCAKYGIEITHADWPCAIPCKEITFDRGGENTDKHIAAVVKTEVGITAGNFNAYHRGDAKGTVEKQFDTLQKASIKFEAGKVVKVPSKEAQHASRNSFYTLDELMKRLIPIIINLNKHQPRIDSHNFEMSRDGVAFTSMAIWNWSLENAVMTPSVNKDKLRFAFLPEAEATVWDKGVFFKGLFYSCKYIEDNDWLSIAKVQGRFKIKIRYSSISTNLIWWRDIKTNKVVELQLQTRSEAYKNQAWEHVLHRVEIVKHELAIQKGKQFNKTIELEFSLDEMDSQLKKEKSKRNNSETKGIQPNIASHKAIEAAVQTQSEFNAIATELKAPTLESVVKSTRKTPSSHKQNLTDPTER